MSKFLGWCRLLICAGVTALAFAWPVQALSAQAKDALSATELVALLRPVTSFGARFEQHVYDAEGYQLQHSSGEMIVASAGRLRWLVAPPMEQWLISDGESMWLYDPDLEQVIIKPFPADLHERPIMLFGEGADALKDNFTVVAVDAGAGKDADKNGQQSFRLRPHASNALYESLLLAFSPEGLPAELEISDRWGQRTVIVFSQPRLNPDIDESLFHFIPPPGVEVLRDPGAPGDD